jgi:hypothetical protein
MNDMPDRMKGRNEEIYGRDDIIKAKHVDNSEKPVTLLIALNEYYQIL